MCLCLDATPEQAEALAETARQFTVAFNLVCRHGWAHEEKNGVRLHHATYRASKEAAPGLVSDLHIQARVKATEATKSALALQKKGQKVSCPQAVACSPRYNVHTYTLDWSAGVVNLATVVGRQIIPLHIPAYASRYAGAPVASADLMHKRGRWFLHVVVSVPAPEVEPSDVIIGVDLGVTRAAVCSDNRFYGQRRWRELEARDFRLRRRLQKKGTKSAKRHLKKLSGRTARRRRDQDHVVSRRIVHSVPAGVTIAVENLTKIRTRVRARKANGGQRRLHSWSFATLRAFITYKAQDKGIRVEGVDPRHTSQTCSCCGYKSRYNRRSQSDFHCRSCGFRLNADLNGARNVAAKLLASRGMTVTGGPSSTGLLCPPAPSGEAQTSVFRRG